MHSTTLRAIALLLVIAIAPRAGAIEGAYDPAFANAGRMLIDVATGDDERAFQLLPLPDGTLALAASCRSDNDLPYFCVAWLRPDGSFDPRYGPLNTGRVRFDQLSSALQQASAFTAARLPDGRLVFGGLMSAHLPGDTTQVPMIAVLAADGAALDAGVGNGAGYFRPDFGAYVSRAQVVTLAVQADGKILAGVTINGNVASAADMAVARFLPDFTPDRTFGTNGIKVVAFDLNGANGADFIRKLLVQRDGRIVVLGFSEDGASPQALTMARLLPTGQYDFAFGPDGSGRVAHRLGLGAARPADVVQDAQGRLVFAGRSLFSVSDNDVEFWQVGRLLANGSMDPTFNDGDALFFTIPDNISSTRQGATAIALQSDGKILVGGETARAGQAEGAFFGIARLRRDGQLDPGFGNGGFSNGGFSMEPFNADEFATAIAIANGGLMVAGFTTYGYTAGAQDETRVGIAKIRINLLFSDGFEATPP